MCVHGRDVITPSCLQFIRSLSGDTVRSANFGPPRVENPGFESCVHQDFSGLSHTSDLKICTPMATLTGACCYRVSVVTGWLGEI